MNSAKALSAWYSSFLERNVNQNGDVSDIYFDFCYKGIYANTVHMDEIGVSY